MLDPDVVQGLEPPETRDAGNCPIMLVVLVKSIRSSPLPLIPIPPFVSRATSI